MKITLNLRPLMLAGGLSVLALAGCTTVVRPGAVVERPAPRPVVVEERVEYVRERPPATASRSPAVPAFAERRLGAGALGLA